MNSKIKDFILREKSFIESDSQNINWTDNSWNISEFRPHRLGNSTILFHNCHVSKNFKKYPLLKKGVLPKEIGDFSKAFCVYLIRNKNTKYISIRNKITTLRYLYVIMDFKNKHSFENITRNDFEELISEFVNSNASCVYELSNDLQYISREFDFLNLFETKIKYTNKIKNKLCFNRIKNLNNPIVEKIPSMEAFIAIVKCLNEPVNENEELLLNIILLLISTGLRLNEITHLPLNCLSVKESLDSNGDLKTQYNLEYFPEKSVQKTSIIDIPLTDYLVIKKSIDRIKEITKMSREIIEFHENNPKQLWCLKPGEEISDNELIKTFKFSTTYYLGNYLKKRNVLPIRVNPDIKNYRNKHRMQGQRIYSTDSLLEHFIPVFKKLNDTETQFISARLGLKLSQMLCLTYEGAFRFKKINSEIVSKIQLVNIYDINYALGANPRVASMFERRGYTEADGSKISLTSHFKRHWRNTIYELAGMSNVNQALSMGRVNINQNIAYQHTSLEDKFKNLNKFTKYSSIYHRPTLIKDMIKEGAIKGSLADAYEEILDKENSLIADEFLETHAQSFHLTPFGGCTHDFSQSPCKLHLECWNGCSNLHRTNSPSESQRLDEQLSMLEKSLIAMKENMKTEFQNNRWITSVENKIENIKTAIRLKPGKSNLQVFPEGQNLHSELTKKNSSTKMKNDE